MRTLQDIGIGKDFLKMIQITQEISLTVNKWALGDVKMLVCFKGNNQVKRQPL